ncbi:MAG: DUF1573 domain-containing protein [Ferruginibacter sp.]
MKKYFLLLIFAAGFTGCDIKRKDKISDDSKLGTLNDSLKTAKDQHEKDEALKNSTTVQLIDSVFNFGTITEGEKVEFSYRFKNTGTYPLVVFTTQTSCGCTVPEKPEKPVLPGETSFIKVVFNSAGKHGHNEKDITINANTAPAFPTLKLIGEIKEKQ